MSLPVYEFARLSQVRIWGPFPSPTFTSIVTVLRKRFRDLGDVMKSLGHQTDGWNPRAANGKRVHQNPLDGGCWIEGKLKRKWETFLAQGCDDVSSRSSRRSTAKPVRICLLRQNEEMAQTGDNLLHWGRELPEIMVHYLSTGLGRVKRPHWVMAVEVKV